MRTWPTWSTSSRSHRTCWSGSSPASGRTACCRPSAASAVVNTLDEARAVAAELGFPLIVRPAFTLGGTGGGIAGDAAELERVASGGLAASPIHQVLVERSLI